MLLSIIVPVYNTEAYLPRCVDSLLDQDLLATEYEIILVDDGSTDKSGQICDMFAIRQNNIHVIHQQNMGPSVARNTGINAAKGMYIQFVDSDDYLCSNVLREIVHHLEDQKLDILRVNYQNVNSIEEVSEPNNYSKLFDDYSNEVCEGLTFLNERMGFACYVPTFVVRSSLIKQNGNKFKEGILYEDTEWTPRVLVQAKRVSSLELITYNYRYHPNSITRNSDIDRRRKSIEYKLEVIKSLKRQGDTVGDNRWFNGVIAQIVLSILSEVSLHFYKDRKQFFNCLSRLKVFPLSSYHATPSALKKIWLANLSPRLLCSVQHISNRIR